MAQRQGKADKCFTYQDFLSWPEDERWEIIDGQLLSMSAAPNRLHSQVITNLARIFTSFFKNGPCEVHVGQLAVRFPRGGGRKEAIIDVVIPDIVVVCDPSKLDNEGCLGGPDFIIEVLSPSTAAIDHLKKKTLYERSGVREYWLVHPADRLITIYRLGTDGKYGPAIILGEEAKVNAEFFPGLTVDFSEVFPVQAKTVRENPNRYL